jgi:hypothetical protein
MKTGAIQSPKDLRTFKYKTTKAAPSVQKGGERWDAEHILDQHRVGICTAISTVALANKVLGEEFSPEFQYFMQKLEYDNNWYPTREPFFEGSSPFAACKVAKNIGFLPKKYMDKWVDEKDRKLSYSRYIAKLKLIPKEEIEKMKEIASEYKIVMYKKVGVDRDSMANAILESDSGLLTRYPVGKEWWTDSIEPLRPPKNFISGHQVVDTNFDGGSFRIANSWGDDWADKGTAYRIHKEYAPTEAWLLMFNTEESELEIKKKLMWRIIDLLYTIIRLKK